MAKFVKKRKTSVQDEMAGPSQEHNDAPVPLSPHVQISSRGIGNSSQAREEINWEEEVEFDPGKRRCIDEYPPNLKDLVRRKYLANGPCQPRTCDFLATEICGKDRRFVSEWFDVFGSWLEYSESKHKAYCFCCFLFRPRKKKEAGYVAFVKDGWSSWNKKHRLKEHVGDINSVHNQAARDCEALLKQEQHIYVALNNQSNAMKNAYYTRLNASIDVVRVLLKQGLPFRGHDESEKSFNKGNFKEFHDYTAEQNPAVAKVVGRNAPANNLLTSPKIQKDIAECFAKEILHSILEEIGHDVFCFLVDESRDVAGSGPTICW
jgi:hypothetical protein